MRNALPETVEQGFTTLLDDVYRSGLPFSGTEMPLTYDRDNSGVLHSGFFDLMYQPFFDTKGNVDGMLRLTIIQRLINYLRWTISPIPLPICH